MGESAESVHARFTCLHIQVHWVFFDIACWSVFCDSFSESAGNFFSSLVRTFQGCVVEGCGQDCLCIQGFRVELKRLENHKTNILCTYILWLKEQLLLHSCAKCASLYLIFESEFITRPHHCRYVCLSSAGSWLIACSLRFDRWEKFERVEWFV